MQCCKDCSKHQSGFAETAVISYRLRRSSKIVSRVSSLCFSAPVLLLVMAFSADSQNPAIDATDLQSWNDLQITIPVSKHFDVNTALTLRLGKNISWLQEGRLAAGITWKPNTSLSFQPSYNYIEARNSSGRFRNEHRLSFRAGYKFPVKEFGLSHRSTFEYRIRSSGNSWRYRPSVTIDKDLPKRFVPGMKIFVTEEPFYDSVSKKFARNRFSVGFSKSISKKLSFELYYLRQDDRRSRPGNLNVIGTSWKVKL